MVDLSLEFCGIALKNPLTTASGTFGGGLEYNQYFDINRLGAITPKGVATVAWPGNPTPRIAEAPDGLINSVGLQNPGVEAYCAEVLAPLREVAPDLPVIANVCSHTVEDFAPVIDRLEREPQVVAYELNISCPNLDCGGMSFGTDPKQAAKVVAACRAATRRPLVVKLTPNVTDITEVARAVEAAGADALSMINTVTGMRIDVKTRRPVLARGFGGLSGPAVHPIAVYAVYRCRQATQLPIIGMGGVAEAQDAVELMLAGASMVAVGSASFRDPCAIPAVLDGLEAWCEANGVARLQDIVGTVRM